MTADALHATRLNILRADAAAETENVLQDTVDHHHKNVEYAQAGIVVAILRFSRLKKPEHVLLCWPDDCTEAEFLAQFLFRKPPLLPCLKVWT